MKKEENITIARRGMMFVLSSPSGAGKSTVVRSLLKDKGLSLSVSVTTRKPRSSEIDGIDYHFISLEEFKEQREKNCFLEWAEVHGNFYGTPLAPVKKKLEKGQDIVFDIDWQGAYQLRSTMISDLVSIFILPPSMKELKRRLETRSENANIDIITRLKNATFEITHWLDYDYVLVNDNLTTTYDSVQAILSAERLRRSRLLGLSDFVGSLLSESKKSFSNE